MVFRGWREATMAPTIEKGNHMAKVMTTSTAPPYGSSGPVDPNILDEYCVVGEVKRGPSVVPTKGSPDGPSRAYPTVGPPGRGRNRFVLSDRRRLLPAQPAGRALRLPQRALRLGDPRPGALPTAQGHRVRTLFPARGLPLLLSPFPRDRGLLAVLFPPSRAQAQALLRALAARDLARTGGGARDYGDRLDPAFGFASAPGFSVGGGLLWGAAWVRWGSFSVYGVKLHLICATNRVPLS